MVKEAKTNKNLELVVRKTNNDRPRVATKHALSYLYGFFHIVGVLPTKKYQYAYVLYAIVMHGCLNIFLPISFGVSYFLMSNENVGYDRLLFSIQLAINHNCCIFKIIALIFTMPRLLSAEGVMDEMDKRCQSDDEMELLHKLKSLARKTVVAYSITYWSFVVSTYIGSFVSGHPSYSLYLPYINWQNSKWEFLAASFIEFLLLSAASYQQVANDSYPPIYVCILRTHVNILRLRIRKLCLDKHKSSEENEHELKMCIKDHQHIIQLYNIISGVISITIFLQFLNSAVVLAITLINILIFSKDYSSAIASFLYIFAVIVEIFPLCYYAKCLFNDGELLSMEIFHSQWILESKRYRKMLIFFMQRSQKQMELTAGKFFPINLNSFINIAKFAFSLYTLIKKMNVKERLEYN